MRQRQQMMMRVCFFSRMYSTSCAFFQFKPPAFRGIIHCFEDSGPALVLRVQDRRMEDPGYDSNDGYDKSTDLYLTHEARDEMIYEPLMRDEGYQMDPMCVAKIVNPALAGGPMWPNFRQAHRVLRRRNDDEPGNSRVIIISDGLVDPCDPENDFTEIDFPNPKFSGFGYEVVGEFRRSLSVEEEGDDDYSNTFTPYGGWEFGVADTITQQLAISPMDIHELLDEWEVMSSEINIPDSWNCPDHLVNKDSGTMAFLLFWSRAPWLPTTTAVCDAADTTFAKALSFPEGSARLLCYRLITPSELATILGLGEGIATSARSCYTGDVKQNRIEFVKGLETDGTYHITDISPSR